jgi:branched-chain amino acid transport system ATP-binding protein
MILEVNGLSKAFGGIKAVDRVDLTLENGSLSAIIGPNGAGKTTLFNLLSGYFQPDSGQVLFKGRDLCGLPPNEICRRGVARSFQIVRIFKALTVFENIQVGVLSREGKSFNFLRPAKRLACEETTEILNDIGLLDKADYVADHLPHGEQRRLDMGIALSQRPRLLLLDEPAAGLSLEESETMIRLVKKITRERGVTTLLVEHDMNVVFSIAEVIRVLHHGTIIFDGNPDAVRANEEVRRVYLGERE